MSKENKKNRDTGKPPFDRTTCDCNGCTAGCRTMPGSLIPGDLMKIAEHCGKADDEQWIKDHFLSSEGARVAKRMLQDGEPIIVQFSVPSIVPAQRENGDCVFLDAEGRCSVHPVAPFGCAYHDVHLNQKDAMARSTYGVEKQIEGHQQNGAYSVWCRVLAAAGSIAPPLNRRREAFLKAMEEHPYEPRQSGS